MSHNNSTIADILSNLLGRFSADDFSSESRPFFEQAISDTSLAVCLTDPHQPDSPIIFANKAFTELTGYNVDEIVGQNCRFLQGPATSSESLQNLRRALNKSFLSVTELINYRKDGTAFLNTLHMAPLTDKDGNLLLFYGSQMDTTETVTVDLARRKRALELSEIGIWELNPANDHLHVDAAMRRLFEVEDHDPESKLEDLFVKIHAEDQPRVDAAMQACFEDHNVAYYEDYRIVLMDGKIRWIRSKGGMSSASNGSGEMGFIGVSSDVTREKEYELALSIAHDVNKTIADELDHRINNVFATIASLVSAGARGESDAKLAAKKTRERIMAMAASNKLTIGRGVYGTATLNELVDVSLSPYRGTTDITVTGEPVTLSRPVLNALGLVFHELSTNSVKYGALNSKSGQLSLGWTLSDDAQCELRWFERGGSKPNVSVESSGFGARLIDMSVQQIGGIITRDFTDEGLVIDVCFPVTFD